MKITVIGGGSTYSPELVSGFLERTATLPVRELWLMDIDPERLEIVGGFIQRMVAAAGDPFSVQLTDDREQAIRGASYVVTQLRIGKMAARREDEYLGQRHGLIGQETTGVGGMAKALRTIPVIRDIAEGMRQLAPGAVLANFTNPAGLITQSLIDIFPAGEGIGVCNVPITIRMNFIKRLEKHSGETIDPARTRLDTLGLNHLSWHRGFTVDGKDRWEEILDDVIAELRSQADPEWDPEWIEKRRLIPNYYLQYYYHTDKKLAAQKRWPPSRAEEVMAVEKRLLEEYADPNRTAPPEDLAKRGGAYYSTAATQLIAAHYAGADEVHVVNTAHRGAVTGWPKDWVLEMPVTVSGHRVQPIPAEPLPKDCFDLISRVKQYELLTVQAAVSGDRNTLREALRVHPLGPAPDQVDAVMKDMLETNRKYLPRFWEG
ncbi:MAG TPA: 6-phospho-beta-glucosidase [Anaerolineales bacterium]